MECHIDQLKQPEMQLYFLINENNLALKFDYIEAAHFEALLCFDITSLYTSVSVRRGEVPRGAAVRRDSAAKPRPAPAV